MHSEGSQYDLGPSGKKALESGLVIMAVAGLSHSMILDEQTDHVVPLSFARIEKSLGKRVESISSTVIHVSPR